MTGGGGFIGRALVKSLISVGAKVVSLSRRKKMDNEPAQGVESVNADIRDRIALKRALSGCAFEYVFNSGGYIDHSPYQNGGRSVIDVHYVGVMNLIEEVWGPSLKRFIQIGSSDEYGSAAAPQKEVVRETPISPYSAAKTAATQLIQTLARSERFPGVVVRLFLAYGPGQDQKRFLPQIIRGCLEDQIFPASQGEQVRDFCYIEDIVEGLILSAVEPKAMGEVINIASGKPVSIRRVIEKVVELIGKGRPVFGAHPYRLGESMELYADISLAKRILQWEPKTMLNDGLSKTIEFYKNRIKGDKQ